MPSSQLERIQAFVSSQADVFPRGGRSKSALTPPSGSQVLDISGLSGLLEYAPSEYTFTALAGTTLAEIDQALSKNGQFLPFDPPFVERGATLGGTIASGLSGSGRYRYGGLRDFILAVQFLDGDARMVKAGGKVVKNAAGFDIPKMMVGSLGAYGAIIEATFKVFPKPAAYTTVITSFPDLDQALDGLIKTTLSPFDLFALDLEPHLDRYDLILRIGGLPASFPDRIERLMGFYGDGRVLEDDQELDYWHGIREFSWVNQDDCLVKVPLTPKKVPQFDAFLAEHGALRRYTVGANLAWIAWNKSIELLDQTLTEAGLAGLVVLGPPGKVRLGALPGVSFAKRVKAALDPQRRWLEI